MTRAYLESLGLTDAILDAELAKLFPKRKGRRIRDDDSRQEAFDAVVAKWFTATPHD